MAERVPRAKDLRTLPEEELRGQLDKLRQALWHDRLKARDGALQQTHRLSMARRQLARIQTVLQERLR